MDNGGKRDLYDTINGIILATDELMCEKNSKYEFDVAFYYMNGGCYLLWDVVHKVYPDSELYVSDNHCVIKLYDVYCDAYGYKNEEDLDGEYVMATDEDKDFFSRTATYLTGISTSMIYDRYISNLKNKRIGGKVRC